jgi:uncharacterized protein YndB with AHSA1/START domain
VSDANDEPALRVERRVAAAPAVVYEYLTDAERWARWQGADAELEAVPGGRFRMTMADGLTAEGCFLELVPDRRVVFTWGWNGNEALPPGSSTVEIELVPDGEGTLVRLTHRGLPATERPIHDAGWRHYLPRLAVVAEGRDPGVDPGPAGG